MKSVLSAAYARALAEPPTSVVLALLPRHDAPGISDVKSRLEAAGYPVVSFESVAPTADARWEARVEVRFPTDEGEADTGTFGVRLDTYGRELAPMIALEAERLRHLLPDDVSDAQSAPFALAVETRIDGSPLFAYHAQLKVLAAIATDAVLFADVSALAVRPSIWLQEAASSMIPPAPSELFTIHAVSTEKNIWVHTHGLARCGVLELEALDVPEDMTSDIGNVINTTAALWLENGVPDSRLPFEIGSGISVAWLPWEEAIAKSRSVAGGKNDRDASHAGPRGVLFVPRKGFFGTKFEPLQKLKPRLEQAVFHVTSFETARKAMLARHRIARWTELVERHNGSDDWRFLVKLGFAIDGARDESEREHLWFMVHAVDGDAVDATLVNEPLAIARLKNGARARYALDEMSDWVILCPFGRFDPETVVHLERRLAQPN